MTIFVVNVHHTQLFSFLQCQECFSTTVLPLKRKVLYWNRHFYFSFVQKIPVLLIENYIYQHEKSGGQRLFFSLPTIKTSHREEFWARGGVWEPGVFLYGLKLEYIESLKIVTLGKFSNVAVSVLLGACNFFFHYLCLLNVFAWWHVQFTSSYIGQDERKNTIVGLQKKFDIALVQELITLTS